MKFLLEIVSCYGSKNSRPKVSMTNPPLVEETRSLVPLAPPPPSSRRSCNRYRSRKRGRVASSRSGSLVEWRPSLFAISEEKDDRSITVRSKYPKEEVYTDGLSSRQKLQRHSRQSPPSTIIPAFSPTPFLF